MAKPSGIVKMIPDRIRKGVLIEGVMSGVLYQVSRLYKDHFSAQVILEQGKKVPTRTRVHQFKFDEVRLFMEPTEDTMAKYNALIHQGETVEQKLDNEEGEKK